MAPAVVVLCVSTSDAGDPSTLAAVTAAEEIAREPVHILVDAEAQVPSDEAVVAVGRGAHASAVVTLTWSPEKTRAVVHVHAGETWVDRELQFSMADEPRERGRAIGLVLGSMLGGLEPPPGDPGERTSIIDAPQRRAPLSPPASPASPKFVFDLGAEALIAGGRGAVLGVTGAAAYNVVPRAGLFLGAAQHWDHLPTSGASEATFDGRAGVAVLVHEFSASGALVEANAAALLTRASISRPTGNPARESRAVPGAAVRAAFVLPLAAHMGVRIAVGTDAAFGTTRVYIDDRFSDEIPPLRVVAELGVRGGF